MQSNTVRRSCQPSPGPIGWPVARSHTSVEARWLVMPTASTGPAAASDCVATSSTASAIAGAVELDQAGERRRRRERSVLQCVHGAVAVDDRGAQPGRADIDHQDAHDGPPMDARLEDG